MNTTLRIIASVIVLAVSATAGDKKGCEACGTCSASSGKKAILVSGKEQKTVIVAANQYTRGVRSVRLAK
jgi:ferredoxin